MLADDIIHFFKNQGFVIVTSIDKRGIPHNSCKGIVSIEKGGKIFLLDLYLSQTFRNIRKNPRISICAVDEHRFKGYSLKGKARIVSASELEEETLKAWDDKITSRLTQRLIKNIKGEKGHSRHPEVLFPKPKYMIVLDIKEVVDLTPHNLK